MSVCLVWLVVSIVLARGLFAAPARALARWDGPSRPARAPWSLAFRRADDPPPRPRPPGPDLAEAVADTGGGDRDPDPDDGRPRRPCRGRPSAPRDESGRVPWRDPA